ncbi:hypothetical protein CkaCkLH20_05101 [Colletotrichum karsti]|uniref:Rhodopsin domain-containing protein n=1 Tax=Colletotrichum karsti TaxID=1095194 RepID=A0A9P6IBB9_9PEZI|nr:uncharacterized protein CkaCkLH20_05101 [Colletotrichum karsti]KAF9877401.1 hypothetical protein CkaCkLH20_05101 [Colletotrichum karsti]
MVDVDVDPNRPHRVLAVAILFLRLTPVAVALRLYSKVFITRAFSSDDKVLCLLQVVFTTFLITEILGVVYGTGRDATEIPRADRRTALQYFFAGELLYLLTTILLKVCVGILLLRIAIVPTHIWILRILLLSTLVFGALYLFLIAFQCRPVHTFWDQGPRTPGHCFGRNIVLGTTFTAASLNCVADWTFGILSLFIVWSLDLRLKTKVLVILLLGFASIVSIATIIRAVTVPSVLSEENFLRDTAYFAIWSTVEPGIGITAACAPSLTPLVRHLCGKGKQEDDRGPWRTRSLPNISVTNETMPKKFFTSSLSRSESPAAMEMPRLRFDDFTYESRISGPDSQPPRPGPPRNRSSWAFPLRSGSGSSSSSAPGLEPCANTNPGKSASAGGMLSEPPSSGIMKTMEIELSYEERRWTTRHERLMPRDECMNLRPQSLAVIRRLTSGEVPLLPGGNISPVSADFDIEAGFPSATFRHSSPPEASWEWPESSQAILRAEEGMGTSSLHVGLSNPVRGENGQIGDS